MRSSFPNAEKIRELEYSRYLNSMLFVCTSWCFHGRNVCTPTPLIPMSLTELYFRHSVWCGRSYKEASCPQSISIGMETVGPGTCNSDRLGGKWLPLFPEPSWHSWHPLSWGHGSQFPWGIKNQFYHYLPLNHYVFT